MYGIGSVIHKGKKMRALNVREGIKALMAPAKRRRAWSVVLAGVMVAPALVVCTGAISSVGVSSAGAATKFTVKGCEKKATAILAAYQNSPKVAIGMPFNMSALKGDSVWFINESATVPTTAELQAGFDAAAAAAGVNVTNFDGQASLSTEQEGINEAISAHAAGIVLLAISAAEIGPQLSAAQAAGIPVVSMYEPPVTPGTIFATINSNPLVAGRAQGAAALLATHCKLDAVYTDDSIFSSTVQPYPSLRSVILTLCKKCKVSVTAFDILTVATSSGPLGTSIVTANKNVNMIINSDDSESIYMIPALQAIHSNVKIIGGQNTPATLTDIQNGSEYADLSHGDSNFPGWAAMDEIGRAILKLPAASDPIPTQLVDKANVANGGVIPTYVNFQTKFEAAWGLSS